MEIKIGIGLEDLIFGMQIIDVKKILGEPDKITEEKNDIYYYYNKEQIKIQFDKEENFKLFSIEVYNLDVLMFDKKIINKTKEEIMNLLKENGIKEFEMEEYDILEFMYCEEICTTFTFELNRLIHVNFTPLYKDDQVIWQARNTIDIYNKLPNISKSFDLNNDLRCNNETVIKGRIIEINIGIGLDKLIFGMSPIEVKKILGEPDKISETEKENGIVYYFYDQLIKTKFDKRENLKLYSIEVHNPELIMFGQKIVYKEKREIEKLLRENGFNKFKYEDYEGYFDTIFCSEIWTTFLFNFEKLTQIEFSPLLKDNKIIWPELA